jgi:hypothetical protein
MAWLCLSEWSGNERGNVYSGGKSERGRRSSYTRSGLVRKMRSWYGEASRVQTHVTRVSRADFSPLPPSRLFHNFTTILWNPSNFSVRHVTRIRNRFRLLRRDLITRSGLCPYELTNSYITHVYNHNLQRVLSKFPEGTDADLINCVRFI